MLSPTQICAAATLFQALADPNRLRILSLVATQQEPLIATDLAQALKVAPPTITHHIKTLTNAGLLTEQAAGRSVSYQVNARLYTRIAELAKQVS